jgi:hypothetical protein
VAVYEVDPLPVQMSVTVHPELKKSLQDLKHSRGQSLNAIFHHLLCDAFGRDDLRSRIPRTSVVQSGTTASGGKGKRRRTRPKIDALIKAELERLIAEKKTDQPT